MNALAISAAAPVLVVVDGVPTTTSNEVAQHFHKQHDDVLRRIRSLLPDTPEDFNVRNFAAVEYTDAKGERRPAYRLTRDGFTLLAMGFTGKKALAFKLAYIDAFNKMEAELRAPAQPTLRNRRWLLCVDHDGKEHIMPAGPDEFFTSEARLPNLIRDPAAMFSAQSLVAIANACAERLADKLKNANEYAAILDRKLKATRGAA